MAAHQNSTAPLSASKRCNKCAESKPLGSFSKHNCTRDGLHGSCRVCQKAHAAAYVANNRERHNAAGARWRKANPEKCRAMERTWKGANPDKVRAIEKSHRTKHRDKRNAQNQEWCKANVERRRTYARAWKKANPDKVRAKKARYRKRHAAQVRAYFAKYRIEKYSIIQTCRATRRARVRGAVVGDRDAYRAFVKQARSLPRIRCYWCHKPTTRKDRHLDHVVPLSRGGTDSVGNLCVSCPTCNLRKNAMMPEEFTGQSELRFG